MAATRCFGQDGRLWSDSYGIPQTIVGRFFYRLGQGLLGLQGVGSWQWSGRITYSKLHRVHTSLDEYPAALIPPSGVRHVPVGSAHSINPV